MLKISTQKKKKKKKHFFSKEKFFCEGKSEESIWNIRFYKNGEIKKTIYLIYFWGL